MKLISRIGFNVLVTTFAFLVSSCNFPSQGQPIPSAVPDHETTEVEDAPSEEVPPSPTLTPTPTSSPTPEPPIVHLTRPEEPSSVDRFLTDISSLPYASESRAVGDDFNRNRLERPFKAEGMEYQAHLDLTRAELAHSGEWFYITLHLEGAPPEGGQAYYGVELDLDVDGRGDVLILAGAPRLTDWSTDGVQVYTDANENVGNPRPLRADPPPPIGDGYEELVFDEGRGPDPDAAWARTDPASNERVQFAFKSSLINADESFLWGVWSMGGSAQPDLFDHHDTHTLAEAGSPMVSDENYPLQAIDQLDSTCRDAYGIVTTGQEPGLCILPASIAGVVWRDRCITTGGEGGEPLVLGEGCVQYGPDITDWGANAIYEPSWEPGFQGVTVRLGDGPCPSSGLKSTKTNSNGNYKFSDLTGGTYCVSIEVFADGNDAILIPGGWTYPVRGGDAKTTVNLSNGENRTGVNFGWMWQFGD